MADRIRIAADAMGGDNAPAQIVEGVIDAVNSMRQLMSENLFCGIIMQPAATTTTPTSASPVGMLPI